ncbi:hypothetical protein HDU81_006028 [Chytriomyces hyalinus]|nr:hypothetical protein HDU81_006028 [Chytriomyces hyalinus]
MSAQVLQPANVVVLDSIAASIGFVGVLLIASVLAAVARYRSQLTPETRTFDWTLITMLTSSLVHAFVITIENIATAAVNESPSLQTQFYGVSIAGAVSVTIEYVTLFVLTGSNVVLAMERLWLVTHMASVPAHWVYLVSAVTYFASTMLLASVAEMPTEHGLEYVPSSTGMDRNNSDASTSPMYKQTPQPPTTTALTRAWTPPAITILVRCIAMGAGIFIFYLPTIAGIFIFLTAMRAVEDMSDWYLSACTILPALDTIWTPLVVLWCQANVRRVFLKMFRLKR